MRIENIGINKAKVNQFLSKGIEECEDLAKFLPRRYYDFTKITSIKNAIDGEYQAFSGILTELSQSDNMIKARLLDTSGKKLYITWFHQGYLYKKLEEHENEMYFIAGKVVINRDYHITTMTNPIVVSTNIEKSKKVYPIYPKIKGMSDDFLIKSINSALAIIDKEDYLESELINKYKLTSTNKALRGIHQPKSLEEVEEAKKRILFDDLFLFNYQLKNNSENKQESNFIMSKYNLAKEFMDKLPFELTDGQRNVLRESSLIMKKGKRLNALIQGDVGVGKTIVATLLMVVSKNNGYQSVLMAPTNVLAKQHYEEIKERLEPLNINVAFLSGETKKKERNSILKNLKEGSIDILIGTHAVMSKDVEFKELAMVIVDEEHRFGVVQRNALKEKGDNGVHTVIMSATPIPRSLAMSLYGEGTEVMTITSMPKGRQPVETKIVNQENLAYDLIYNEVQKGKQGYIVCPLIEDSDSDKLKEVDSVETTYSKLQKYYKGKNINIGVINGKMKQEEINKEIQKFSNKEYDVIISTTIIEVGVNVPNATIIMIKNAERFGLAQLHQLRGRVGRGKDKSYCILYTNKDDTDKLSIMEKTNSGFDIARHDLVIRGVGEFLGTQQTGKNKYVMLMLGNDKLNTEIRKDIDSIVLSNRNNRYKKLLEIDISEK